MLSSLTQVCIGSLWLVDVDHMAAKLVGQNSGWMKTIYRVAGKNYKIHIVIANKLKPFHLLKMQLYEAQNYTFRVNQESPRYSDALDIHKFLNTLLLLIHQRYYSPRLTLTQHHT